MIDPCLTHVIFDLEATESDPTRAEIVEIAAIAPGQPPFHRYVDTEDEYPDDHQVWAITRIDRNAYNGSKVPLEQALRDFLIYIGERPLAGHNILRYDIPLLTTQLEKLGLSLPQTELPAIDTLRWAQMLFPTPPEGLRGYRLGDLYEFFTGEELKQAHQALKDCEANLTVLEHLYKAPPPEAVLKLWAWLELPEARCYGVETPSQEELSELLKVQAAVKWVNQNGKAFPTVAELEVGVGGLLGTNRPSQLQMMRLVEDTLRRGGQSLIQAPTGTGKTRGYLYPAHRFQTEHPDVTVVVATHTKVLQQQALQELQRSADKGFSTWAIAVKSARDYLCLEALADLIEDKEDSTLDERAAQGMLAHYARQGLFDLEAIPPYWEYQPAYREVRFHVRTNPGRCREACPFFQHCAYQTDLRQRRQANFWITNQAWLLSHFLQHPPSENGESDLEELHLIIDEAHNLEDVATGAFTHSSSEEDLRHHLNRIFERRPKHERGLLRNNRYVPDDLRQKADEIRQRLIPNAVQQLDKYSEMLVRVIKQYGRGDAFYSLTLPLVQHLRHKSDWPRLRNAEDEWIRALKELRDALLLFPRDSWLGRNLSETLQYFKEHIDLLYERRKSLRELPNGDPNENLVHQSEWSLERGWTHLAQPIDIAGLLQDIWGRVRSLTLTSATLAVGGDFQYLRRTLGLTSAQEHRLPEVLPYDQAYLIIPGHLPEARGSTQHRFQAMYHRELEALLPVAHRSLTLFTSTSRMREAAEYLKNLPSLYLPLTRREREDVARVMSVPGQPGAALGSKAYMEGVDFPDLKVVNLERIPFPIPSLLLEKRQEQAKADNLDPWRDVYLPRALLTFVQAFGRLIRDDRERAGRGAFILWDKRLLNAAYQLIFLRALPKGVNLDFPTTRSELYTRLATILGVTRTDLPLEELKDEALERLEKVRGLEATLLEKARELAKAFWGLELTGEDRRSAKQLQAMQAAFNGRDLLVLLPTGFGKSLTFQIPAFLEGGLTLVVSPLIALMKDQAETLQEKGLPAAALHSMLSSAEQRALLEEVRHGRINLLYVSPERVNRSQDLQNLLRELADQGKLRRLVMDEAHCLSEWGYDFRPDYLKVAERLRSINPDLPITALTATATPQVTEHLTKNLGMRDVQRIEASYDRANLQYYSYQLNDIEKLRRLVQVLDYLEERYPEDSAIIYAATRAQVERLAWALRQLGYTAEAYHAGLSPLLRHEVQTRFMNGDTPIMVATSAFGMGVDKENVRAVIHFNPPPTLEAYIQEAGRAGRDEKPAFVVLLHNQSDWGLVEYITGQNRVRVDHATALMEILGESGQWSGYAKQLSEAINSLLNEAQQSLQEDFLVPLLTGLEDSEVIQYHYRIGKVSILYSDPQALLTELGADEARQLELVGFTGRVDGEKDELDFSLLTEPEAEALNQTLFDLWKRRAILTYHSHEAVLEVKRIAWSLHKWTQRQATLKDQACKRLQMIQQYAKSNHCKRALLLQVFDQTVGQCSGCQSCNGDDAPWKEARMIDLEELETVYRPLETLLRYMRSHEAGAYKQDQYIGLGATKLVMALRGEEFSFNQQHPFKLSSREVANHYFGHLAFVKPREIEKAIQEAIKKGYLLETPYMEGRVYRISEAGKAYLDRQTSRRQRQEARA